MLFAKVLLFVQGIFDLHRNNIRQEYDII